MLKLIRKFKRGIVYALVIICTYTITSTYVAPYTDAVKAISYYYGSRGGTVYTIQSKLKAWYYYDGSIDGVYGFRTYSAVRRFQAKNGLRVDGVAGDQTLEAMGINVNRAAYTAAKKTTTNNKDLMLLARLINGEARGEPYEGQVAVGAVILNRTRDPRFPSTVAGVIYQPGAFTAIVDGQVHANMEKNSIRAAQDALNGWDPSGGAVYYFNPNTATSAWIWSRPLIKVIGSHRFCR